MAKEPQLLPGMPKKREYVNADNAHKVASAIENLKLSPRSPTARTPSKK